MLGLLAAASLPGIFLALGTLLAFFAHQPIKVLAGSNKAYRSPALAILFVYGISAAFLFFLFLNKVTLHTALPFYLALVLMAFYLIMDILNYSRRMFVEIMAPTAIGLIAVSLVLASGWTDIKALGLGFLLAARFVPTPFYIRARLQLEKNQNAEKGSAIFTSGVSLVFIILLTVMQITPILGLAGVIILVSRVFGGLSSYRKKSTVKAIGMREFFYGQVLVILSALGYWFSI